MATLEDQIREIRTAISAVQAKKARAAVELDNARERLATARQILKDEFGVVTTDDARTKLDDLRGELAEAIREVEDLLESAGA